MYCWGAGTARPAGGWLPAIETFRSCASGATVLTDTVVSASRAVTLISAFFAFTFLATGSSYTFGGTLVALAAHAAAIARYFLASVPAAFVRAPF